VVINGKISSKQDMPFSVPQGSVAGPVAFTCYASTLEDVLPTSKGINIIGYADDHSIYCSYKSGDQDQETSTMHTLESSLVSVKKWMDYNKLKMNNAKTEAIIFNSQYYNAQVAVSSMRVNDCQVDLVDNIKLLGVMLDHNLTLKTHIQNKCTTASKMLNMIRKIRRCLTFDACRSLVQSLVIVHIDYCNSIYYGLPDSTMQPLQSIQNQAAKLVLQRSKYDSAKACLRELHWLPVKEHVEFKVLTIVFKSLNGQGPNYFKDFFQTMQTGYSLRSTESSKINLKVPKTRTKFGDRTIMSAGPRLWNSLPQHIKQCQDLMTFRKSLKTRLFTRTFLNSY
jgi:hypothetical protein